MIEFAKKNFFVVNANKCQQLNRTDTIVKSGRNEKKVVYKIYTNNVPNRCFIN